MDIDIDRDKLLKIMKAVDTCHDFKGGKRGADNINVDTWLNATIQKLGIASYDGIGPIDDSDQLLLSHKPENPSESRLEPRFAEYLEIKFPSIFEPIEKEYLIIDGDDKHNEDNLKNFLGLKSFRIILNKIDPLTNNLNYIGKFIHEFMFDVADTDIGFVIDANSGKLPLFFVDDDYVKTYVNALVMADSAGTGENEKTTSNFYSRRQPYVFPALPDSTKPKRFSIKGCLLFCTFVTDLYYEESSQGSFATDFKSFKLVVEYNGSSGSQHRTESFFAPTNKQGPTINTLSKLIQYINNNITNFDSLKENNKNVIKSIFYCNDFEYESGELDIRPILIDMIFNGVSRDQITTFLFDFKRTGDYGQVDSAYFMGTNETYVGGENVQDQDQDQDKPVTNKIIISTGDQLCSMYARFNNKSCVYNHHNNNGHCIDLYKGENPKQLTVSQCIAIYEEKVTYYARCLKFYEQYDNFDQAVGIFKASISGNSKLTLNDNQIFTGLVDFIKKAFDYALDNNVIGKEEAIKNIYKLYEDDLELLKKKPEEEVEVPVNKTELSTYTVENKNAENKLSLILGIIYKLTEKIANLPQSEDIDEDDEKEKLRAVIDNEKQKFNEENIFNYDFSPQFSFLNLFEALNPNTVIDKKIVKDKEKLETLNKPVYKRDKTTLLPISPTNREQIDKIEKSLSIPTSVYGKYRNGILDQITVIDSEIEKIIKRHDELMQIDREEKNRYKSFKVDNNLMNSTGSDIIEKYRTHLNNDGDGFGLISILRSSISGGENTPRARARGTSQILSHATLRSVAPDYDLKKNNNEIRKKETLSQNVGNLLQTISDNINSVFKTLKSNSFKPNVGVIDDQYVEEYVNKLQSLSREDKKTRDDKKLCKLDDERYYKDFVITAQNGDKLTYTKQIKCDYDSFITQTINDFNVELLKLKEPSESKNIFYETVTDILQTTENEKWIKLISNLKESEIDNFLRSEAAKDEIYKQLKEIEEEIEKQEKEKRREREKEERERDGPEDIKLNLERRLSNMGSTDNLQLYDFLNTYSSCAEIKENKENIDALKSEKANEVERTTTKWNSFAKAANGIITLRRAARRFKSKRDTINKKRAKKNWKKTKRLNPLARMIANSKKSTTPRMEIVAEAEAEEAEEGLQEEGLQEEGLQEEELQEEELQEEKQKSSRGQKRKYTSSNEDMPHAKAVKPAEDEDDSAYESQEIDSDLDGGKKLHKRMKKLTCKYKNKRNKKTLNKKKKTKKNKTVKKKKNRKQRKTQRN